MREMTRWRRLRAVALTLALNAAFVAVLLMVMVPSQVERPPRVHVMRLLLLPRQDADAAPVEPGRAARKAVASVPIWGPSPAWNLPETSHPAGRLGRALFDCRPETLDALPAEARKTCQDRLGWGRYRAPDGSVAFAPPSYRDPDALRISDIQARKRNTADPCLIAKESGTECIHAIIYGNELP